MAHNTKLKKKTFNALKIGKNLTSDNTYLKTIGNYLVDKVGKTSLKNGMIKFYSFENKKYLIIFLYLIKFVPNYPIFILITHFILQRIFQSKILRFIIEI